VSALYKIFMICNETVNSKPVLGRLLGAKAFSIMTHRITHSVQEFRKCYTQHNIWLCVEHAEYHHSEYFYTECRHTECRGSNSTGCVWPTFFSARRKCPSLYPVLHTVKLKCYF
jgi:hypothetical protein